MKRLIRKLIPNSLVNYGKHLPTAVLANIKYAFPARGLTIIGVTGTDGKTTTANMIYKILKDSGKKVSLISTINAVIGDKKYDTGFHVTSPTHFDMQRYISEVKKAGSEILILEITSMALSQFRVWGVNFDIGVVTNITDNEHLDYHGNFENYLKAKVKLIKNVKYAVLNKDDRNFEKLSKETAGKVISFGLRAGAVNLKNTQLNLKIPGEYNLSNALAAVSVAQIMGVDKKEGIKILEGFGSLSGRMEEVKNAKGIKIYVDFAHTPNALEQALKTLRGILLRQGFGGQGGKKGRVIAVFGAASERDTKKRPIMGQISARLADITILTDEDPRFESSDKIIDEIARGALKGGVIEGKSLFREADRKKAISMALRMAKRGDTIGIFGKGHERSMNYRGKEVDWSDVEVVKGLLRNK